MAEADVSPTGSPKPPTRKIILATLAGILLVGGIMAVPSVHKSWTKMLAGECRYNLYHLGKECLEYAEKHDGRFPSTWVELNFADKDDGRPGLLYCPQPGHGRGAWAQVDLWADYRLLPGRTTNDPEDTILAVEPLGNHDSTGANVLFVDGSVQWLSQSRLLGRSEQSGNRTNSVR